MRRLGHVPALDAVRGIAILLVLALHAGHVLPGGRLGVDLFFVLSGFLITSLLVTEWSTEGGIGLRHFYRRRALRLLPALFVMLAVYAVASLALGRPSGLQGVAFGFLYVYNAAAGWFGFEVDGLDHLWSLAAEEQFYLLWPPLLVVLLRFRVGPSRIASLLLAAALAVLAWRTMLVLDGEYGQNALRLLAPDARAGAIVLGCLAGIAYSFELVRRVPLALATLLVAIAALVVLAFEPRTLASNLFGMPLFVVACATAILAVALHPEWFFTRLIDRAPLRWLGKISYGLYVWHVPIFVVVGWKIGLPLSIAVAVVSFRYIETPFLRRKHRRRQGHPGDVVRPKDRDLAVAPAPA